MSIAFSIGLDLGQKRDHSAIVIVERVEDYPGYARFLVRHAERLPLGTPYPEVVNRVCQVTRHPPMPGRCNLAVDATGVGGPVLDLLRTSGLTCQYDAVTITGGEREVHHGGNNWSVPRRDLISTVQIALEQGDIRIAKNIREGITLTRELLSMRSDRQQTREHDDLVLALALACWRAKRKPKTNSFGTQRIPGI